MIKLFYITLLLVGFNSQLFPQSINGEYPITEQSETSILTSDLLKELDWENLMAFCDTTEGQYAQIYKDSLLTEYSYTKQGGTSYFILEDFRGKVLSFRSENSQVNRPSKTEYFDKDVWLDYSHEYLHNLPDSMKLSVKVRKEELVAYYQLLGVGTRDEYGWICEYSTVGMAPGRRQAVIQLRLEKDLLLKLFDYPNPQTQMYIADILIFGDFTNKKMIEQERNKDFQDYLQTQLLSEEEWEKIYNFRDSNKPVKICGNSGSYMSNTKELLSDEAIKMIPEEYERLSELGYLKLGYKP